MSVEYHHVAEGQDFRVRSGIRNLGQGFRSGRGDQRGEQKKGPNNFWLHLPELFRPNNKDEEEEAEQEEEGEEGAAEAEEEEDDEEEASQE